MTPSSAISAETLALKKALGAIDQAERELVRRLRLARQELAAHLPDVGATEPQPAGLRLPDGKIVAITRTKRRVR